MNKTDKSVMIGSLIMSAALLYMIKPAVADTYCQEWEMDLSNKFDNIDRQLNTAKVLMISTNDLTEEELITERTTLQRASLLFVIACSDITYPTY